MNTPIHYVLGAGIALLVVSQLGWLSLVAVAGALAITAWITW